MIKIEFAWALSVFLSLTLLLAIGSWIVYNYCRNPDVLNETDAFYQCPICTYVFFDYRIKEKEVVICPRCKSYLSKGMEVS